MFKKRLSSYRAYRLSERSFSRSLREETGYNTTDSYATDNASVSKSELLRLHSITVRKPRGKNNNDIIIIANADGSNLEFKDNEIRLIEAEIPNISLELSLFLDAGLVVSAAFEELISLNKNNQHIFYRLLRALNNNCIEKNLPLINELFIFAQQIKSKSLMRFMTLILDNKAKGSALLDKLDKERTQMQSFKLNAAKAKAREAETKLCFPLMLLLIALITICSAPALMQM